MKRAQRTDLLREMKKSFNRYISILAIMALGVAFYAGVRSSEPDMQLSAKKYFNETDYMDIRVLGTLGMTESDVAEISAVEGVAHAEGGYQTELFLEADQRDYQMSVFSMGDGLNRVYVTEGRVPEAANECFVDRDFMSGFGYKIGDTITLRAEKGTELSDVLSVDTFTIVGEGIFPNYLSWERGAVSIGTGVEDGFLFLPQEAFSMEVYTVVYAIVEGAKDLNPYQEEYADYIDGIVERIEAIAGARCEFRYKEVTGPYWEDIRKAETEIADGEKELADGERELEDAWAEILDGEQQLVDAEQELADALAEISDGEVQLADAEKELADGEAEFLKAEKEIEDGEAKLAGAEKEIEDGEQELAEAEQKLLDGDKQLTAAKAELAEQEEMMLAGEAELLLGKEQLTAGKTELEEGKLALSLKEAEFNAAKTMLEAYGMPLTPELLAAEAELAAAKQLLALREAEIVAGEARLAASEEELLAGKAQIVAAKEQLEASRAELEAGWKEINSGKTELEIARKEVEEGKQKLAEGRMELEKARKELADGRKEVEDARAKLTDGRKQYEDGLAEYQQAKIDIADGKKQYEDGLAELEQAKVDLEDGKKELADAKAELEEVDFPEWYVLDRATVQQVVEYGSNTERVGNLGDVFPAVFYLVAALVSLTTMTRMIEEERIQIGTMKALGYGKGAIVSKYLWYSLSATLLGGVIGIVVGSYLFPWVIMKAYGILYTNIPYILTPIQWDMALISVLIAVVCTVVATMSSCYKEMMAAPAILMRPVAPPVGKRVFLEYIKPVWNAMSFSWKATFRNIFRYKKRFFMTIFGIGGCMALLLVGFGLRDSIMDIVNKQYTEVWTYDAYLSINDENVSPEDKEHWKDIENYMFIHTKTMDVESAKTMVSATLFVPESLENLDDFAIFRDRVSKEKYSLTGDNTIITEKLAKLLDVSVGDTIELYFDDVTKYPVTVDAIAENYMFHYVYISAEKYEELCKEAPENNQLYLKTVQMSEEEKKVFSGELLADERVDSITYVEELRDSVSVMMKSLELVIVVLIVAAGMLAFIVLYNLNNINIIERRRELATLKVLGFYDMEVANYVYRENVLLTILGTIAGIVMGFFLHRFVILTVEIDIMMFGREIKWQSFLYSVLLTGIFAVLINLFMFYKLRKIDMVESLKSAE